MPERQARAYSGKAPPSCQRQVPCTSANRRDMPATGRGIGRHGDDAKPWQCQGGEGNFNGKNPRCAMRQPIDLSRVDQTFHACGKIRPSVQQACITLTQQPRRVPYNFPDRTQEGFFGTAFCYSERRKTATINRGE